MILVIIANGVIKIIIINANKYVKRKWAAINLSGE